MATQKHQNLSSIKLNKKQLKLTTTSVSKKYVSGIPNKTSTKSVALSNIHLYSISDRSIVAELIWALNCVASNYSFASTDGIVEVFQTTSMFPDTVPKSFSLSRSKLTYLITNALGPYFQELTQDNFLYLLCKLTSALCTILFT